MRITILASAALAAAILMSAATASAADEDCMRSCQARGYEYSYCLSRCSRGGKLAPVSPDMAEHASAVRTAAPAAPSANPAVKSCS